MVTAIIKNNEVHLTKYRFKITNGDKFDKKLNKNFPRGRCHIDIYFPKEYRNREIIIESIRLKTKKVIEDGTNNQTTNTRKDIITKPGKTTTHTLD